MAIKKAALEKMNELLTNGTTIAELQRRFKKYDYWEVYWESTTTVFSERKE